MAYNKLTLLQLLYFNHELTTLRGEYSSSLPSFRTVADGGSGSAIDISFRLTTSPEARRVTSAGEEVMASPRIGESGEEDEVRVQMRYSAKLDWLRSSRGGESGNISEASKIITVCYWVGGGSFHQNICNVPFICKHQPIRQP
jgi:hypothetical protein